MSDQNEGARKGIVRAACEAKAREIREETERRCRGRLSPKDREAVDSVVADIIEGATRPPEPPPPPFPVQMVKDVGR